MPEYEYKHVEMMEKVTNQIVVLSGGALVLSITLIDKFGSKGLDKWAIVIAWILFGLSILSGLGRNWANAVANQHIIYLGENKNQLKDVRVDAYNKKIKKYSLSYTRLEVVNQISFALGCVLLIVFTIRNYLG